MLKEFKKILLPPYNPRDLYSIFITLFIVLAIPVTVLQVTLTRDTRSQAALLNEKSFISTSLVNITDPSDGEIISGVRNIQIEASDESYAISSVSLIVGENILVTVNNTNASSKCTTAVPFDSTKFKNGETILSAIANNTNGLVQASNPIKIVIGNNDLEPPTVSFETLRDGSYVSSLTIAVKLNVADNLGIEKVSLLIDGRQVKEFFQPPYLYSWVVGNGSTGNHKLAATATDFVGNTQTSEISVYKSTTQD